VQYSIPLIFIVLASVLITHLIDQIKTARVRTAICALAVVLIGLQWNVSKGIGLRDYSTQYIHQSGLTEPFPMTTDLYRYLNGLPKNALMAAQPYLADSIPAFAQRKVFINFELSHPFFDRYWTTIKTRTIDFFDAYYAQDCATVHQFAEKYHIDYFVVDRRHFEKVYLSQGKIYFEPFNSRVKASVHNRDHFFLMSLSEREKLFTAGDLFVFNTELLNTKCPLQASVGSRGLAS
jgi:hypothetical protein